MYTASAPSKADLLEIEAEWPVIQAALAVTDAECRMAGAPDDVLAVRAHRRAVRRLLAAERAAATADRTTTRPSVPAVVPGVAA